MTALVEREAVLPPEPSEEMLEAMKGCAPNSDDPDSLRNAYHALRFAALRQPGAEYRRAIGDAYEALMTYVRECNRDGRPALFSVAAPRIRALSDSIPDTKGGRDGA